MRNCYAGIGSRETPPEVCAEFRALASTLATAEMCLRSGGADGADTAFEEGCDAAMGRKAIFIPWSGFNGRWPDPTSDRTTVVGTATVEAFRLAASHHPSWDRLTPGARRLHARNGHQVLGLNLDDPVAFVICWTVEGRGKGGTGQALRIAKSRGIPIYDFGDPTRRDAFYAQLETIRLFGPYAF